jgi:hypothetical protein
MNVLLKSLDGTEKAVPVLMSPYESKEKLKLGDESYNRHTAYDTGCGSTHPE